MTEEMWMLDPIAEELDKACDTELPMFGTHTLMLANSDGIKDWDETWTLKGMTTDLDQTTIDLIKSWKTLSFRCHEELELMELLEESGIITIEREIHKDFSDSDL